MMPEMSFIYEKAPDPITLDVYPDATGPSSYVMYDCKTVKSPIEQTTFGCTEDKAKIEISIGKSDVSYELWVHCDSKPASVAVGSKELPKLADKRSYDTAAEGWYYGRGCFYGPDQISTVNTKIPKSSKPHLVRIVK
jgi:hypothetical protein